MIYLSNDSTIIVKNRYQVYIKESKERKSNLLFLLFALFVHQKELLALMKKIEKATNSKIKPKNESLHMRLSSLKDPDTRFFYF